MTHIISTLFFLIFFTSAFSQSTVKCKGLELLKKQETLVVINNIGQTDSISKKDLIHGLSIKLSDTSFQIKGFVAASDCHSGRSMIRDMTIKTFYGNSIKGTDPFLKGVWENDILVIECINVSKQGKQYLAKPVTFRITD